MTLPVVPAMAYLFVLVWTSIPLLPAEPVLLAGGSYAAAGGLDLPVVVAAATVGSFVSDLIKYGVGRVAGPSVLRRLRRSGAGGRAVAWTESRIARTGPSIIVPSYFVPGGVVVSTVLCGALRTPLGPTVLASAAGAALWATGYGLLGWAGGALTGDPLVGLLLALSAALGIAVLMRRSTTGRAGLGEASSR